MTMVNTSQQTCRRCSELQNSNLTLQAKIDQLRAALEDLKDQLAEAKKDSSNLHQPPSSDLVKPPRTPTNGKPRVHPEHPGHFRPPYLHEELTGSFDHWYCQRPDCGGQLNTLPDSVRIIQLIREVKFLTKLPLLASRVGETCVANYVQHKS